LHLNTKTFKKFAFFCFLWYNIFAFIYLLQKHGKENTCPWNPKSKSKKPLDFFFKRKKQKDINHPFKKAFKNNARILKENIEKEIVEKVLNCWNSDDIFPLLYQNKNQIKVWL